MSKTYLGTEGWWNEISPITDSECDKICQIDAKRYVSDKEGQKLYLEKNAFTYRVCISTWLLQIADISYRGALSVQQGMRVYGLREMVSRADESAFRLIHNWDENSDEPTGFETLISDAMSGRDKEGSRRHLLQVLRYAKKLTVTCDKELESRTIESVLEANRSCREASSLFNPIFNVSPRSFLGQIIDGIKADAVTLFQNFSLYYDEEEVNFTKGTANDIGTNLLIEKLYAFASEQPFIFDRMYPFPETWEASVKISLKPGDGVNRPFDVGYNCFDPYEAELSCVPKSYKAYRPVAPESVWRQAHLQAVKKAMERCIAESPWAPYLTIKDQDLNREAAKEGSIDGHFATIDLSSASDRIPRRFIVELFPKDVVDASLRYLARYIRVGNKKYKMWMWSTAGSSITWITEHAFFFLLALQVKKIMQAYRTVAVRMPRTFGDDLIIDSRGIDLMTNVLTRFNGILSEGKSYWSESGGYRESCGAEYFFGDDMSTSYFPRQVLKRDAEGLACLCALQHKLWDISPRAAAYIEQLVLKIEPRMTAHKPYTECADLWSDIPRYDVRYAPHKGQLAKLPIFYQTGTQYLERKYYLAPRTKFSRTMVSKSCEKSFGLITSTVRKDILDMYLYAKFLRYGNQSDDPLLRLLGVSDTPLRPQASYMESYVVWDWTED